MPQSADSPQHIKTTETFLRLYVLFSQYLDRCHDEAARQSFPEAEFQDHLEATRAEAARLFSTNKIVHDKIAQEYDRILKVGTAYVNHPDDDQAKTELLREREVLRIKTLTLSDLLAVFRSLP